MAISNVHIDALADPDLAQIFKHLPPFDRLRASEVCKRWWFVSQDPWREVSHLELISTPSESIGAIVRKCPNLASLVCKEQQLILDDLKSISLASFKSLELHYCSFVAHDCYMTDNALPLFRPENGQSSMEELTLHCHKFNVDDFLSKYYSQRLLPVSLKRLQLSGLSEFAIYRHKDSDFSAMGKLRTLESLILDTSGDSAYVWPPDCIAYKIVGPLLELKNLRELLIPALDCGVCLSAAGLVETAFKLPLLEIFFVPNLEYDGEELLRLFVDHPALRVLVFPGFLPVRQRRIIVPIRNRFPRGFAAKPLPFLDVFLGKMAAELFHFKDSPANGLRVHPIDAPMPEFLEREEVNSIFEGSWIAKQIKEEAKRGTKLWAYEDKSRLHSTDAPIDREDFRESFGDSWIAKEMKE